MDLPRAVPGCPGLCSGSNRDVLIPIHQTQDGLFAQLPEGPSLACNRGGEGPCRQTSVWRLIPCRALPEKARRVGAPSLSIHLPEVLHFCDVALGRATAEEDTYAARGRVGGDRNLGGMLPCTAVIALADQDAALVFVDIKATALVGTFGTHTVDAILPQHWHDGIGTQRRRSGRRTLRALVAGSTAQRQGSEGESQRACSPGFAENGGSARVGNGSHLIRVGSAQPTAS